MHDAWHAKECDGKRESQFQRKVFLMFEAKVTSNDAKSSAPWRHDEGFAADLGFSRHVKYKNFRLNHQVNNMNSPFIMSLWAAGNFEHISKAKLRKKSRKRLGRKWATDEMVHATLCSLWWGNANDTRSAADLARCQVADQDRTWVEQHFME